MPPINQFLIGAIVTASLVIALFFLRFWRTTGDTFFIYFALAFTLEAISRVIVAMYPGNPVHYLIRVAAYALIVVAIIQKNRKTRPDIGAPDDKKPVAGPSHLS